MYWFSDKLEYFFEFFDIFIDLLEIDKAFASNKNTVVKNILVEII